MVQISHSIDTQVREGQFGILCLKLASVINVFKFKNTEYYHGSHTKENQLSLFFFQDINEIKWKGTLYKNVTFA